MQDILIIGGGIAGLSAAAALAGIASVTLLETETALGFHASGRSAALYEPTYGPPPVRALTLASHDAYATAGLLRPRGLMIVATAAEEAPFAAETAGPEWERITGDAARQQVPILGPQVAMAAVSHTASDIDTDRLMQGNAAMARAAGARIVTGATVTRIARVAGGWQVEAGGESHEAAVLVNAAGAWADRVAVVAGVAPLGLVPHRRSMARIPAPGGHDVSGWPMLMGVNEAWYARPDAGALIVSPADEEPVEPHDAWADDMVLAEGLARYEAMVTEPVTRMLSSWAGLRTFSPDRVPVIGPDAGDPAFVWFAGQGGYGFQMAPAAAALLAALVAGRAHDAALAALVAPGRFA